MLLLFARGAKDAGSRCGNGVHPCPATAVALRTSSACCCSSALRRSQSLTALLSAATTVGFAGAAAAGFFGALALLANTACRAVGRALSEYFSRGLRLRGSCAVCFSSPCVFPPPARLWVDCCHLKGGEETSTVACYGCQNLSSEALQAACLQPLASRCLLAPERAPTSKVVIAN